MHLDIFYGVFCSPVAQSLITLARCVAEFCNVLNTSVLWMSCDESCMIDKFSFLLLLWFTVCNFVPLVCVVERSTLDIHFIATEPTATIVPL